MPYQQNKPAANDQLNDSQGDIQGNFLEIFNWVAVNHGQFDTANVGKHTQVTLPYAAVLTPPAANEAVIYSAISPYSSLIAGNNGALFWKSQNNTATIPLTVGYFTPPALPADAVEGFTFLPSGLLIKFGRVAARTGLSQMITYPLAPGTTPAFTAFPFMVMVFPFSIAGNPRIVNVNTFNTTTITVSIYDTNGAPATSSLFYIAIGIGQ